MGDGESAAAAQRRHFPLGLPFIYVSPLPQNLYDSIKNEPFKIPEDDGNDLTHTFFNPDREGWLLKLGTCVREGHGCLIMSDNGKVRQNWAFRAYYNA